MITRRKEKSHGIGVQRSRPYGDKEAVAHRMEESPVHEKWVWSEKRQVYSGGESSTEKSL